MTQLDLGVTLEQDDIDRMAWADAKLAERRVRALRQATMQPGSWDKRFVRDLCGKLPESFTEAQHRHIVRLAWKYRRQIGSTLSPAINPADPFADPRTGTLRPRTPTQELRHG